MLKDILAIIAPACLVLSLFSYFRCLRASRLVKEQEEKLRGFAQKVALDIAGLEQSMCNQSERLDQVARSFVGKRHCPQCDTEKQAHEFDVADYICSDCRKDELLDNLIDELGEGQTS